MGWILSTGHSCVMFLDSKNVVFVEILLWPSFSTKSGGMPGFYRVKFGHNRISTKFTFLESGNVTHECPVLGIHHKFRTNLSKLQGRSDRGNLQKTLPWFCDYDVQRSAICTRLCECCKPAGAEVISNNNNKIHQTWCIDFNDLCKTIA